MGIWQETGYHTTDVSNRDPILDEGFRVGDNGDDTWAGAGVYFWGALLDAQIWSKARYRSRETVILASRITVPRSNVLDLTDQHGLSLYEDMYHLLIHSEVRGSARFPDGHALDRAIIQALSCTHDWKVVVFADNRNRSPKYIGARYNRRMPSSYILDQNTRRRVIYCVRDPVCIRHTTIIDEVASDETAAAEDAGSH